MIGKRWVREPALHVAHDQRPIEIGQPQPRETLLVVDGLTGQDAVNVATEFDGKVGISGVVLTRMDGDGRGGAALSMRAVTGKPIRFVGLGEQMDAIETFEPGRIAWREGLKAGDPLRMGEAIARRLA